MSAPRNALTSKLFWELIDRSGIADDPALHLLGRKRSYGAGESDRGFR